MAALERVLYWSIILTRLISLRVYGERCLSCNEVIEPRHCNVAVECAKNEICFTQKYIDISGEKLYNVGCMDNRTCARFSANAVHTKAYFGNQQNKILSVSCQQCCTGKACNLNGCGAKAYPGDKGLLCFQCKQHRDSGNCLTFQECFETNARCYVDTFEEFGDKFYQHGCSSQKHCSSNLQTAGNPLNVFGKKRQVRSSRLLNRTCCDSDFCNDGKDTTSTTITEQHVVNQFGKEFFLSFPSPLQNVDKVEVMLTGTSDATVTFESHVMGVNRTVIVPANKGLSVFLPLDILYIYNGTKTAVTYKTAKVVSDVDITVFVVLYGNNYTSDGYLALPRQTLGRVFSLDLSAGILGVTAIKDNTNVLISETFQNNSRQTNHTFMIAMGQTLYVSFERAVVVSIESQTNIHVVETIFYSRPLYVESALPLQSPSTYVLPPLRNDTTNIACFSNEDSNSIYFSKNVEDHNFNYYVLGSNYTSSPVIASTNGTMHCLGVFREESLASFQSISSFSNNYLFKTPTSIIYTHLATLTTPTQYKDGILDNGNHLSIINQFEVQFENIEYTVMWLNITNGIHHIVQTDIHAKFGLTLYGQGILYHHIGYSYPAGFERIVQNRKT